MNNIPPRQNERQAIDKLKAQRHKYTIAKLYGDANFICFIIRSTYRRNVERNYLNLTKMRIVWVIY